MTKSYKLAALWMAATISVFMLGCQNADKPSQGSSTQAKQETSMDSQAALLEDGGSVQESEADKTESGDSNILITYFAVAENSDVDAASSTSMVAAEGEAKGRMTYLAELIEEATGRRPEITVGQDNPETYDTLILGFPVWDGEMPMAVPAFLESFDLTGKRVIPFVAEESGDLEKLQDSIVQSAAGAEVELCRAISGEEEIAFWLKDVGVFSELIRIRAGDNILYGGLYQNREAYEFAEFLPLTADLYIPADFARAFNLDTGMENGEYRL